MSRLLPDQPRRHHRMGLTLIELVVVMVILIALAGILLPLFPSMLTRAHTSTTATNLSELSKATNTYYNLYQGYPNFLDNLVTGSSSNGGLYSLVPAGPGSGAASSGSTSATATTDLFSYTLTANDLAALNGAGLTYVLPVIESPSGTVTNATANGAWTPTFNPYGTNLMTSTVTNGIPTPTGATLLAASTAVVGVSQIAVTRELGVIPSGTNGAQFVLFGVGDYTSMAGKTLEEAPYHFDDGSGVNPSTTYCRFGLIFMTQDGSGTPMSLARFIGAVDLDDANVITTAADHIQSFFQTK